VQPGFVFANADIAVYAPHNLPAPEPVALKEDEDVMKGFDGRLVSRYASSSERPSESLTFFSLGLGWAESFLRASPHLSQPILGVHGRF